MGKKSEVPIRLSRWTHTFSGHDKGYIALFHSLLFEVVYVEDKFSSLIERLKLGTVLSALHNELPDEKKEVERIVKELKRCKIAVPISCDDMELLREKQRKYIPPPGIETLYLLVTDVCNLGCTYCFIQKNMPPDYRHRHMTFAVAQQAVDMFFRNLRRNPPEYEKFGKTIYFYGGEPLLNFRLIREIVSYVETSYREEIGRMGRLFRFVIITNGTVVDEEIARFIGDHKNIDVAISIDGPEEIHDKERPCLGGRGSFSKAIRGLELLKSVGGKKKVAVSATVSDHNIDHLPALLDLQRQHGFASINLNLLVDTAERRVSKEYMEKASQRILEYFVLARREGVYEDRVMRKVKAFMQKRIHSHDCQGLGAQLVCSPDGQLGVCHEGVGLKNFFFARVSDNFDFHSNPVIAEWKKRTPLNMPQCFGCPALGICGGGCAYGAWLRSGSIWSVDDRFCIHSLATLEWLIWDLFENISS